MHTQLVTEEYGLTARRYAQNGWTIVEVTGELDVASAPALKEALDRLVDEGHRYLILDLSSLDFMDSMGLGTTVRVTNRIRTVGGALRIVANRRLRRTFRATGLETMYEFYNKVDEALSAALA